VDLASASPKRLDIAGSIGKGAKLVWKRDHDVPDSMLPPETFLDCVELQGRHRARPDDNHEAIREAGGAPECLAVVRPIPGLDVELVVSAR
jgi:hypothetical protein